MQTLKIDAQPDKDIVIKKEFTNVLWLKLDKEKSRIFRLLHLSDSLH